MSFLFVTRRAFSTSTQATPHVHNLKNIQFIFDKFKSRAMFYGQVLTKNLILLEPSEKYNSIMKDSKHEVLFKLKIEEEFCNIQKTMHGGASSTLVDIATTIAISGLDRDLRHSVSVELSCYYLNPIKHNSEILIHCKVPKIGKALAYSYADIYDAHNHKLLINASHIKAMMDKTWKE